MNKNNRDSDAPGSGDLQKLVQQLDKLAERRQRTIASLPIIIFTADDAAAGVPNALLNGFVARFKNKNNKNLVPHAYISAATQRQIGDSDFAFFDELDRCLQTAMPQSMGKLELPNVQLVRDILEVELRTTSYKSQLNELSSMLHQKRQEDESYKRWFWGLFEGLDTIGWVANLASGLDWLFYKIKLNNGRKYRWFAEEVTREIRSGQSGGSFLSFAVDFLRYSNHNNTVAIRQRLLVLALLQDLRDALKPRLFSIRRSRRRTPFTLVFEDVRDPQGPVGRFLATVVQVMDQLHGNFVMILVSASNALPSALGQNEQDSPQSAVRKLRLLQQDEEEPLLNVHFAASQVDDQSLTNWLQASQPLAPRLGWRDFWLPSLAYSVVLLAVAIGAVQAYHVASPTVVACDMTRLDPVRHQEIIGITDGHCGFGNQNTNLDQTEKDHNAELVQAENLVFNQNNDVDTTKDTYINIVFVAPFTVPHEQGRGNQSSTSLLEGVAIAQKNINQTAKDNPVIPKLRVLIANTGDRLMYGPDVVNNIIELNKQGRKGLAQKNSIVGVAGIAMSLDTAKDMAKTLTENTIPVFGSTLTGDTMSDGIPLFYQVSARNIRQAQIIAAFSRRPVLSTADGHAAAASNAIIVENIKDDYSQDLADDIVTKFSKDQHSVLKILTVADTTLPNNRLTKGRDTQAENILSIRDRICNAQNPLHPEFNKQQDIIFYTGRSQRFNAFLDSLRSGPCTGHYTIVAGSDIAQWGNYDRYKYDFPDLYYTTFASRNEKNNTHDTNDFLAQYPISGIKQADPINDSNAARANDSAWILWTAASNAYGWYSAKTHTTMPQPVVTAKMLADYLSDFNNEFRFSGASGLAIYNNHEPSSTSRQVPYNKPVLVIKAGTSEPVMSCGNFKDGLSPPFWGKDNAYPCPDEHSLTD